MRTIESCIANFKERAIEMGIDISMEAQKEDPNRYNIELTNCEPKNHSKDSYALIGLASHFCYRKWAKDISYIYIMKDHISLTFTDESD